MIPFTPHCMRGYSSFTLAGSLSLINTEKKNIGIKIEFHFKNDPFYPALHAGPKIYSETNRKAVE